MEWGWVVCNHWDGRLIALNEAMNELEMVMSTGPQWLRLENNDDRDRDAVIDLFHEQRDEFWFLADLWEALCSARNWQPPSIGL